MAIEDRLYRIEYVSPAEMDYLKQDQLQDNDDGASKWTIRPPDSTSTKGYIEIYPTPDTACGYIYFRYYKEMTDLDSYGDTTDIPIPRLLVDFAVAQMWRIRQDDAKAQYYETRFKDGVGLLRRGNRRQVGQPDFIQFRGQSSYRRYYGETENVNDVENYW
jgi:hypothetical protein